MTILNTAVVLLLFPAAEGPSLVDRVVEALGRLASLPQESWKAGPDLQGIAPKGADPSRPEFHDSAWLPVKPGTAWTSDPAR